MKTSSRLPLPFATLAAACLTVSTCGGCRTEQTAPAAVLPQASTTTLAPIDVPLEPPRMQPLPSARVQYLVDASASMGAAAPVVGAVSAAIRQAVSFSKGVYFTSVQERSCYFAAGQGIFRCQSGIGWNSAFSAGGYTNLHEAVRSSREFDLTLILTDGVPSSLGAKGDCTAGVDAGCVASELASSMAPRAGQPQNISAGLWLLPFLSVHKGQYFTEQQVDPLEFSAPEMLDQVRRDTGTSATVDSPHRAKDGTLLLRYEGPRSLVLLAIAADNRVGVGFVNELYRHADLASVVVLKSMKQFTSGVALLNPIEVFPGTVPEPHWETCRQLEDQNGVPVVDIPGSVFDSDCRVNGRSARVTCAQRENQAPFRINTARSSSSVVVGELVPHSVTTYIPPHVSDPKWTKTFADELELHVGCNAKTPVSCGSSDTLRWELTPSFHEARQSIARDDNPPGGAAQLRALSTDSPSRQPHRIFGLQALVENFYERLPATSDWKHTFALDVCNQ